ncbi:hypothetical protein FACS1894198_1380 [Clostridia bacterium]|nr:hypothetical protein FACS1894198_1380 [Clostridia bacterium]
MSLPSSDAVFVVSKIEFDNAEFVNPKPVADESTDSESEFGNKASVDVDSTGV